VVRLPAMAALPGTPLRATAHHEQYGCGWRSWDREDMKTEGNRSQFFS
jgi:hypothetical protein